MMYDPRSGAELFLQGADVNDAAAFGLPSIEVPECLTATVSPTEPDDFELWQREVDAALDIVNHHLHYPPKPEPQPVAMDTVPRTVTSEDDWFWSKLGRLGIKTDRPAVSPFKFHER